MRVAQIRAPIGLQLTHRDAESAVNGIASCMGTDGVTLQEVLADAGGEDGTTLTSRRWRRLTKTMERWRSLTSGAPLNGIRAHAGLSGVRCYQLDDRISKSSLVSTTREGYRPFSFSFLGSLSGAGDEVIEPTDVPNTLGAVGDMLSMPGTKGGEELKDARRNASTPFFCAGWPGWGQGMMSTPLGVACWVCMAASLTSIRICERGCTHLS